MEPEFSTAEDNLPKLPKPRLDDRTFEDLVKECILRIPRYCPEWTNYNPGDPGITLIELFAWLVDQMLYRFNQVPRRHYVAFLELLGIRLLPPTPASTELTFYLSKAQNEPKIIPAGTEVATIRTTNQEAVVFTTARPLHIGQPQIKHVLRSSQVSLLPESFNNRFAGTTYENERQWNSLELPVEVFQPCRPQTCFYLVLEPADLSATSHGSLDDPAPAEPNRIEGNVLALTVRGPAAVTTGINPDNPPLQWEVWTGHEWQRSILRKQTDDRTRGFSFDRLGSNAPNPEQEGADIILHLPQQWPRVEFGGYQGHWIRCVYIDPDAEQQQYSYQRSPEITGLSVRTIGGVVSASECVTVEDELLGASNGKPSQVFELRGKPVLERTQDDEHIQIHLPDGRVENWQEVDHLGSSSETDQHYLIDSQSGQVQFGPLIREPTQLQRQTHARGHVQSWGRSLYRRQRVDTSTQHQADAIPAILDAADRHEERQYGRVPPLGAEIYMRRYRVGGGSRGNVQAGQLSVLKTSIPYVKRVVNYADTAGGTDAESLDEAIMRVPALLRTRETALTPEEFEQVARRFKGQRVIHRAHCITTPHLNTPGVVYLLVIPTAPTAAAEPQSRGIHPDRLQISFTDMDELQAHLNTHKALGIRVKPDNATYVGVQVRAEIIPHPQYATSDSQPQVRQSLCDLLYRFLNPIEGGFEKTGWPLGRPVRSSDIIALLQAAPEVQYVADVELFCVRRYGRDDDVQWVRTAADEMVALGELEVACSWATVDDIASSHEINFLRP